LSWRFGLLQFDWDPEKSQQNEKKHGVSFNEAATVFSDYLSTTFPDPDHSIGEERFITIGMSEFGRLFVVVHADEADTIRIISARNATRHEKKYYEKKN